MCEQNGISAGVSEGSLGGGSIPKTKWGEISPSTRGLFPVRSRKTKTKTKNTNHMRSVVPGEFTLEPFIQHDEDHAIVGLLFLGSWSESAHRRQPDQKVICLKDSVISRTLSI